MGGISDKVRKEGMKFGMKAMSKLMEEPERAEKVMKAVQGVQSARERMDDVSSKLLHLGQVPAREDVKELERQAGKLRRRGKKILAALDDLEEALDELEG
jgi:predicted  nucleic acid-binding Zn-ribbon protein